MDFAEPCPLVRPGLPLFGFCSSGRSFASALLSDGVSRRPPLRLASPLSHRTWAEDFHLQAVKHARHTRSRGRPERAHRCLENPRTVFHELPQAVMVSRSEGDISISLRTGTFLFRLDTSKTACLSGARLRRRVLRPPHA